MQCSHLQRPVHSAGCHYTKTRFHHVAVRNIKEENTPKGGKEIKFERFVQQPGKGIKICLVYTKS